jgi:hypothetical protein
MTLLRIYVLLGLATAQVGCATTSGQDWLNSPVDPPASPVAKNELYVSADSAVQSRPRLRHTVTLGESYVSSISGAPAGANPSGDSLHVSVRTLVPVTVNNYTAYGWADRYDAPRAVTPAPRSAPLQPGQDFPSPPSYGPAFPYRSGPASPWSR